MGAQRGLLFLAPWLFLSFIGAVLAFKTPTLPRGWRIMLPLSIFGFPLIVSGFVDWTAGLSMGPRHLLALLPVMAIATHLSMKYKPESSKLRHLGPLLVGLWVSSAAICVTSAYVFPYFDTLTDNPFFEVTVPVLMNGGSGPTLWDAILDSTTVWAIALLFTALLLTFRGLRLTRGREEPRSAGLIRGLLIVLAICAHLGVSLQIQSPGDHGEREVLKARAFAHEMLGQEQQAARVHKVLAAPPANGRIPR